jgi:hypothetical protein
LRFAFLAWMMLLPKDPWGQPAPPQGLRRTPGTSEPRISWEESGLERIGEDE